MAAVIVMERTSGLSIRNKRSSISSNYIRHAKVTHELYMNSDLIMQTENHNIMTGI